MELYLVRLDLINKVMENSIRVVNEWLEDRYKNGLERYISLEYNFY